MGFEKYTNYTDNAGVSGVVFGSEKPVLEVELNEMQEIQKTFLRNTIKNIIGNGITDKSKITYKDGVLSVAEGCAFAVDGYLIQCTGLSINVASGIVYLQVWEEDAGFSTPLYKEGNQQSTTVENYFKDSRYPSETSRRKLLKYTLSLTEDNTKHNLPVASVNSNGTFTHSVIKEINLTKLTSKVEDILSRTSALEEMVLDMSQKVYS